MSKETLTWLNSNTLIGDTDIRGTAWHHRAEMQGDQSNHYPGPIPVEDVIERLFNWKAVEGVVSTTVANSDGKFIDVGAALEVAKLSAAVEDWDGLRHALDQLEAAHAATSIDVERKAIIRPDTNTVLGVFKQGYQIHDYQTWLINNIQHLMNTRELHIGSAGLLRKGGVAWVQINTGQTVTACGFEFLPFLSAAGSLDGTVASIYKVGCQAIVCDNTLSAALAEETPFIKFKSSSKSLGKIDVIRDTLGLLMDTSDTMVGQIETLAARKVTERRFTKWAHKYVELDKKETKRATDTAMAKVDILTNLWKHDNRVTPWKGTEFGVLQTANTYMHHFAPVKGATRADRNAERLVMGKVDAMDAHALKVLATV
jgi:phage/plasmid-like protein (TIGR03299 family)